MADLALVGEKQIDDALERAGLETARLRVEGGLAAALDELSQRAEQRRVHPVGGDQAADGLLGENAEWDARRRLLGHPRSHAFVLTLEDAEGCRLQQRVLVVETAIDGSRC